MTKFRGVGLRVVLALLVGCEGEASQDGAGGSVNQEDQGGSGASSGSSASGGSGGQVGMGATGGSGGEPNGGNSGSSGGNSGSSGGSGGSLASGGGQGDTTVPDPLDYAAGFDEFFMHDECTAAYPPQPDTCLHDQLHEESFTFGGDPDTIYRVTLRIRGLFEPMTISGGMTPYPEHPYFKVGGTVASLDWSRWHIEVSEPEQTYWLNHYPSTSHTIYQEDFEATLEIAGGAEVVIRAIDGNDREIDNAEEGPPDRRQIIEGVTEEVLDGQVLRLDVISVEAQE